MSISTSRVIPDIGTWARLTRPGLTGMVAFSALIGYLAVATTYSWTIALTIYFGIALLSAAASILNQIQERVIDAKMVRTRMRPLVVGEITVGEALLLVVGCAVPGLILLVLVNLSVALIGLLSLLFYNGLYTPLKQHSSLALFPGALSGALPVAAGWLAASGSLFDPVLYSLLIFMVLWQVPHFICMAIRERADYSHAGLALIPPAVSTQQLVHLARLWVAALAVGGLQLVVIGLIHHPSCLYATVGVSLWLLLSTLLSFRVACPDSFAVAQGRQLKIFLLLYFLLILVDAL